MCRKPCRQLQAGMQAPGGQLPSQLHLQHLVDSHDQPPLHLAPTGCCSASRSVQSDIALLPYHRDHATVIAVPKPGAPVYLHCVKLACISCDVMSNSGLCLLGPSIVDMTTLERSSAHQPPCYVNPAYCFIVWRLVR